jgi:chromosomal replication initiation ATPase DnaA
MEKAIEAACAVCGCTEAEIRSASRKRHLVIARKIVARLLAGYTIEFTGRLINRDHSCVHYYRRMFDSDLAGDRLFRDKLAEAEKQFERKSFDND